MKFAITYKYECPSPAGPFKGRDTITTTTKPKKGDIHFAPFGSATIMSVRIVKES